MVLVESPNALFSSVFAGILDPDREELLDIVLGSEIVLCIAFDPRPDAIFDGTEDLESLFNLVFAGSDLDELGIVLTCDLEADEDADPAPDIIFDGALVA
jgi:hypothetical protein